MVYDLDNRQIGLSQAAYNSIANDDYLVINPSGVQASLD